MAPDFKRGSSFILPERGRLYAFSTYLDGRGTADTGAQELFRYSIYTDASGLPDTKVYEQRPEFGLRGASPPLWHSDLVGPFGAVTLDAGRYWLVMHTGILIGPGGVIRNYGDGTAGNWYGNSDTFADGATEQFGPGTPGNGTITAYISYAPASVTSGQFGRTKPGTLPSSGLKANFSRASRFALEGNGFPTLTGLHAYLDGLGGASGSQKVRMVLYGECHHEPCASSGFRKLAESQDVTITAGTPARWVHFAVPSVALSDFGDTGPGYEIAIQSGDTAGVVRDFSDRHIFADCCRQGRNWFGMPDAFADGAAEGGPGIEMTREGTLSVYATYSLAP